MNRSVLGDVHRPRALIHDALAILLGAAADQLGAPDLQDEIALEELDLGASSHEKGPLRALKRLLRARRGARNLGDLLFGPPPFASTSLHFTYKTIHLGHRLKSN